ncbi:MAG TPA: hypothetical protein VMH85_07755 [Terriglobales bacterium]|nr:hypothetical protein [Terriglobales bacterium]
MPENTPGKTSGDERDILELLKFELQFLEQGGYGRSVKTPWKPTSIFQDSLTCLNFNDPDRPHPCGGCLLMKFVPELFRNEAVPCHHIPLNPLGETVYTMERQASPAEVEETLKEWLRTMIHELERRAAEVKSKEP